MKNIFITLLCFFSVIAFSQIETQTNFKANIAAPIRDNGWIDVLSDTTVLNADISLHEGQMVWVKDINQNWQYSGTGWSVLVTGGGGGSGDVSSSTSSSVADRVATFDGTTGKLIKQSNVSIDAVGNMSGIGNILLSAIGTVDGRDLSVDGAKLDGIPVNATAPQALSSVISVGDAGGAAVENIGAANSGDDAVRLSQMVDSLNAVHYPADYDYDVYIVWGQSNMVGRDSATVLDSSAYKVYELCRGRYSRADGDILLAENPMQHIDSEDYSMSPALEFGRYIQYHTTKKILLVPAARGSSPISYFQKEQPLLFYNSKNIYDDLFDRISVVLANPRKYRLKGILWQQGESDTSNELYVLYKREFARLFMTLKQDLGEVGVPVFQAGFSPTWRENVGGNAPALSQIVAGLDTTLWGVNNYYVDTDGLFRVRDNVHFENEESRKLGIRLGMKVAEIVYGDAIVPETPFLRVLVTSSSTVTIEWEKIYTTNRNITDIKVFISGVENTGYSNLITDHNAQFSVNLTGITFPLNIQISAVNDKGEGLKSPATNITYSSVVPSPTHHYQLDETTGTTITDTGSLPVNGTLNVDASTVTTTSDAQNAFLFTGAEVVTLSSKIILAESDTWSMSWDVEDAGSSKIYFGDNTDDQNYFATFGGLRLFFKVEFKSVSAVLTGFHKYCVVVEGGAFRIYRDAVEVSSGTLYLNTQFEINVIGSVHTSSSFNYTGKMKDLRIWNNTKLNIDQITNL